MKYGIACRSGNDRIAGLFVNTDPSGFCRESEFQAIKTELAVREGKITREKIYSLGFKTGEELVAYIKSLKGAAASDYTRNKGLQGIIPNNWFSKNIEAMRDVQIGFVHHGGARGRDYLVTLIALHKENLGIIKSSSTDDKWGIKAPMISDAGSGENKLGKIHMKLAEEFSEKFDNHNLGDFQITEEDINNKRSEIRKLVNNGNLNVMRINGNNVRPALQEYIKDRDKGAVNNQNLFNVSNFFKTALFVGAAIAIAFNISTLSPFIAYVTRYPIIVALSSLITPVTNILGRTAAFSLAAGAIAGTIEQTIEATVNLISNSSWASKVSYKDKSSVQR